jgi:hypothetical protein
LQPASVLFQLQLSHSSVNLCTHFTLYAFPVTVKQATTTHCHHLWSLPRSSWIRITMRST